MTGAAIGRDETPHKPRAKININGTALRELCWVSVGNGRARREGTMPDYKLCFLDDAGRLASVTEFSASDDERARLLSLDAVGDSRAQLWRAGRLLAELPEE